jgi:putative ABC transport system ATP-binding protein
MTLLSLNQVCYSYKGSPSLVIDNISGEFTDGSVYAIMGPSGSGKSTLLSLLAGLDLPVSGKVAFKGKSTAELNLDRYRREDVSMIFQAFHLFPLMTAVQNVCYPMELRGTKPKEARPAAVRLLESVGITGNTQKRFPSQLSGGEQQRIAIARALASGAKVLLADEPTGNLDTANTQSVLDMLCKLAHNKGFCVIIVTHDAEVAAASDITFRMRDGRLEREARL